MYLPVTDAEVGADGKSAETGLSASDSETILLVEALEEGGFRLVLLDIDLPDSPGLELLTRPREQSPVVAMMMVTGSRDRSTAHQAMELDAQAYVTKPFDQVAGR